jgi:hypothetical protein
MWGDIPCITTAEYAAEIQTIRSAFEWKTPGRISDSLTIHARDGRALFRHPDAASEAI